MGVKRICADREIGRKNCPGFSKMGFGIYGVLCFYGWIFSECVFEVRIFEPLPNHHFINHHLRMIIIYDIATQYTTTLHY